MQRLALMAMLLVACGRGAGSADGTQHSAGASDTMTPAVSQLAQPPSAVRNPPSATRCPPTGAWAECAVFDRLDRAGLAPRRDTGAVVDEPPLTPAGSRILVGTGQLELYLYADERARRNDQGRLDPAKYVRFDAPVPVPVVPTLIVNANLIAILHSRNDHLRERVADALTAGPPQPPTPTHP